MHRFQEVSHGSRYPILAQKIRFIATSKLRHATYSGLHHYHVCVREKKTHQSERQELFTVFPHNLLSLARTGRVVMLGDHLPLAHPKSRARPAKVQAQEQVHRVHRDKIHSKVERSTITRSRGGFVMFFFPLLRSLMIFLPCCPL